MLSAGAFLTEYNPDFFAGVPWIPFVEQITNSGKAVAVASFTVHTIVDGDKTHIVAGENDVCVLPNGQVISAKPAEIFDQPATDKPLLNQCKAFLYAGAVKIGSRISVIPPEFSGWCSHARLRTGLKTLFDSVSNLILHPVHPHC